MTLNQDLRLRLIKQIRDKSNLRKKVLKIEKFYFNEPIDDVSLFDELPRKSNGDVVSFANIKGSTMLKMLRSIEIGDIYGWVDYGGTRCKIRPKKIGK